MFSSEKPAAVEAMTHFSLVVMVLAWRVPVCSIFNSSKMGALWRPLFRIASIMSWIGHAGK